MNSISGKPHTALHSPCLNAQKTSTIRFQGWRWGGVTGDGADLTVACPGRRAACSAQLEQGVPRCRSCPAMQVWGAPASCRQNGYPSAEFFENRLRM
jgi:hypothetical protein